MWIGFRCGCFEDDPTNKEEDQGPDDDIDEQARQKLEVPIRVEIQSPVTQSGDQIGSDARQD